MCEVIEIRVLALGNADSIIVVLRKGEEYLILLIDTGRASHLHRILNELEITLKKYNKTGPDLVICTHYDFDHIGSLDAIVGRYRLHIREVWMHKTSKLIDIASRLEGSEEAGSLILLDEDAKELSLSNKGIIDYEDEDIQKVLRDLKHEVLALKALNEMGIEPKEPINGLCSFDGWPEIEVLGPTYEYYKELFPDHFDFSTYVEEEKTELRARKEKHSTDITIDNAFDRLDAFERTGLSSTNKNSAIIQIETHQGKFLFAGDAGIESFKRIPDFESKLKNIFFLKVPHHGSANNLNSELIRLMNPQIAFVPGGTHITNEIVLSLRKQGTDVYTTKDNGTLVFPVA